MAALLLAGCASEQYPQPTVSANGAVRGIDMAMDSSDVAAEIQGRPWLNFVARYYRDPNSRLPALSPAEAQRLSSLGVKIVAVWEWHSTNPVYFSYASGYYDALNAYREAYAVGQPPGSAIYFAIDFNARGAGLYQVDRYFRGVNAGLAAAGGGRSPYRIGVYGSGAVCASVKGAGLAQYAWLSGSTSWDGTAGYTDWNIRQAPAGERFGNLSFSHDANEATNHYGGFRVGESPAATIITAAATVPATAATIVTGAMTAVAPQSAAPPPPLSLSAVNAAAILSAPAAVAEASPTPAEREESHRLETASLEAASGGDGAPEAESRLRARPAEHRAKGPEPHRARRAAPSRARTRAHAVKALAAPKRKGYAMATHNRAAARPARHPGGSSHAELHERRHRLRAPRRSEDHGAHLQTRRRRTVSLLHRPARRRVEQQ
ncbi:MAG: glycoside hydrolase domain-containing protein [Stellaceae bacterium]